MDPGQDGYDVMSGIDDLEGPPGVVEPLKAAFKRKTEPGGGWTAHRTAADGAGVASYFVQWIVAAHPGVTAMQDITVEVWQAWQAWRASSLSSRKSGVAFMRALLLEVEDLPEPTVEAVRGRRRFAPNSDADEQAFRDVSWRVAVSAITRIGGNAERMARYRAGETPADDVRVRIAGREWSGDELLDYVFHHGALPGRLGSAAVEQLRSALKVPRGIPWAAAIFPIQGESAALQFLFVLEGGYSPLALRGLKVGDFGTERREDTAALAAEAAAIRFGTPDAAETLQAKRETLHRIAEFIGRPARDWLAAHGDPTDALFVAYGRPIRSASAASQFTTDWSQVNRQVAARSWTRLTGVTAGDGSIPSVMRLRAGGPPLGERRLLVRVETDAGIEVYDFSDLAYLPSQWVEPLCAAFGRLAGPGGEWRAKDIVLAGSGILRRLARELPATNPGLTAIADITKEIWGRWRNSAVAGPAGSRAAVDLAQSLLQEAGWLGAADAALSSRPTAATLPDPGWRPAELTGEGGLHGRMPGGDGLTWDFRAVPAPLGLKEPIAAVFAQKAGIGGTWKSPHTVKGHEGVKRFLRSFAAANPNIATIEDVTAEAWWRWIGEGHAGRSPSRADVRLMRALLTDLDGLRETTRQALTSRRLPPREPSGVTSYDAKETKALSTTAARDVRAAARRIGTNLDTRDLYRRGEEPADAVRVRIAGKDWSAGELLHHQSLNGTMPGYWDTARGDVVREMLGLAEGQPYGETLFLNSTEMFSLQMLFVIEGGYNVSSLTAMTIGNFRADDRESDPPVEIREHDKPRRGSRRFFSETLMGDLQKLEELAEWITQPGRDALAALGYPTDALWVGIASGGSSHPSRRFISGSGWSMNRSGKARRWSERTGVSDNTGAHHVMQRLRRTHQVIQRKPMGNTQETHDTEYVIPDPRTSEHARDTLPRIQQRIIGNAKENVKENEHQMRVLGPAEAAAAPPSQDTAVVACSDISHSPFAEPGELCPVSLRTCFTCPNSYMGPRHLPRVITYMSEMKATTRHLPAEEWQDTHADTYATLQDAIEQFTEAELNEARDSVTAEDVAVVRNVLRLP